MEPDARSTTPSVPGQWRRRRFLGVLPLSLAIAGRSIAGVQRQEPPAPRSRTVRVNGVALHYLEWGDAQGPAMVLLHPAPLNARVWERFGAAMARTYRVIAPDARGFGESEWSSRYEPDDFLADLAGLLDALSLRRPILCGNSMGATTAYMFAGQFPERVDRLVLIDVGPGPAPDATRDAVSPTARPPLPPPIPPGPFANATDAAAAIPPMMGPAFARAMVETNLKPIDAGRVAWRYDHARVGEAAVRSMADPRKWPLWQAVQCPTLLLRGERSPALSAQAAKQAAAANQHITLEVVPGAGHFVPIDAPDALESVIRRWLQA